MCDPCSILPNFLNIMRPDLQSADQREWWRVLCQLQETLRDTADFLVKVGLKCSPNLAVHATQPYFIQCSAYFLYKSFTISIGLTWSPCKPHTR